MENELQVVAVRFDVFGGTRTGMLCGSIRGCLVGLELRCRCLAGLRFDVFGGTRTGMLRGSITGCLVGLELWCRVGCLAGLELGSCVCVGGKLK